MKIYLDTDECECEHWYEETTTRAAHVKPLAPFPIPFARARDSCRAQTPCGNVRSIDED